MKLAKKIEDGIRELVEETGLKADFDQLVSLGQLQTSVVLAPEYNNNEFQHIFLFPTTVSLTDFKFNEDEVCGMVEIPLAEGIALMQKRISSLSVEGVFVDESKSPQIKQLIITDEDFVPAYLKTDEFLPRLFIAALSKLALNATRPHNFSTETI